MHEHLSRELFRAIHKGWRNPGDLAAIAMAHLFELCPHCQHEFETWRSELGEGVAADEGDYDGALQRVRERTAANDLGGEEEAARVETERREARSRAKELLALPDDQRLDWIRNERTCHSGFLLAEALIEECRKKTPSDPREGCILAILARIVLHHAPVTVLSIETYARALAHLANAYRVSGDLPRAEQILADARYLSRTQPASDRFLGAEVDTLEGSLRTSQYRGREAVPLLLRALMIFQSEECPDEVIKTYVKLARAHAEEGEVPRALELIHEARRALVMIDDPRLALVAHENEAWLLARRFGPRAGIAAYSELEESFALNADPVMFLRHRWSVARLVFASGDRDEFEDTLQLVRDGFSSRGMLYDAALCALSQGQLYKAAGRVQEAKRCAEESLPILRSLGVTCKVREAEALDELPS